jgi:DMSO/TMAO reductase YedYZ molybdopterin-dependent catalytic subunit
MSKARKPGPPAGVGPAEQQIRRLTRRSFLWGAGAGLAGLTGWAWLRTRAEEGGLEWPLRRVLEFNEQVSRKYFRPTRLAPTFPAELAREPRVNGDLGLGAEFDPADWKLRALGAAGGAALELTLEEIKALPRVEMVAELKCIEGWSVVVRWAGARLADFAAGHGLAARSGRPPAAPAGPDDLARYVGLETPDGAYYVGLEMASALHAQTLLCYEMNGAPLTLEHGGPLRLVTPLKYGIKHLKRIGTIAFTDRRPRDFWAERGYDWYAGH